MIPETYEVLHFKADKKRAKHLRRKFDKTEPDRDLATSLEKYEQRVAWDNYKELKKVKRKKDYIRE